VARRGTDHDLTFNGDDRAELAARIKRLRQMRRLSQVELANLAGVSAAAVSQLEQGRLEPPDGVVKALADAFQVTSSFLTATLGLAPPSRPWLRAYADASKKEADARIAASAIAAEYVHRLHLQVLPDRLPSPVMDADDDEQIEEVADAARHLASIDSGAVVPNAVRAAERLGCIVLPAETELGRHVGMSLRCNHLPIVWLAKSGIPGDRQRFTIAHELGHLILHADRPAPASSEEASRLERQANRFAAAFLTPGDAVIETLQDNGGRVTLQALTYVKATWGVSIKSLVGRYHSLGIIDDDHARSLYKQISARRWTKTEPVDVPNERAQWFAGTLARAAGTGRNAIAAATLLANQIGGNAEDLHSFAEWDGTEDAEVIDIAARTRTAGQGRNV
jgi:Zn-dependent peptidase ImmA (M78 family)/transcriptional regulator with XRE-family HTH domain